MNNRVTKALLALAVLAAIAAVTIGCDSICTIPSITLPAITIG